MEPRPLRPNRVLWDLDRLSPSWRFGPCGAAPQGAEAPELDAVAPRERVLDGIEESVDYQPAPAQRGRLWSSSSFLVRGVAKSRRFVVTTSGATPASRPPRPRRAEALPRQRWPQQTPLQARGAAASGVRWPSRTGSLRSRQQAPARHAFRYARTTTERRSTTCGIVEVSTGRTFSCLPTPNVGWTLPAHRPIRVQHPLWEPQPRRDWRRKSVYATFLRADRAVHHPERNRMMARTKRSRRSYGAGEWGRNRVRVFPDPKTCLFQVEWREEGGRLSRSLKAPRAPP